MMSGTDDVSSSASATATATAPDANAPLDPAARYPCNHCTPPKFFKRRHDRDRHIQTKHLNERPFSCPRPACGLATNRRDQVRRHIKNHPKCAQHVRDHADDPVIAEALERVYGTAKWFVIFDSEMKEPSTSTPASTSTTQTAPALPVPLPQALPGPGPVSPNLAAVQVQQQAHLLQQQQHQALFLQQQQQQQQQAAAAAMFQGSTATWLSPSPAQLPATLGGVPGLSLAAHPSAFMSATTPHQLATPAQMLGGAGNASFSLLDMSADPTMPTFSLDMATVASSTSTPSVHAAATSTASVSPFLSAAMGPSPSQHRLSLTPDPTLLAQYGLANGAGAFLPASQSSNPTLLQPNQLHHPSLSPIPLPTLAPMPAPLPGLGPALGGQPTGMYPPSTIPTSTPLQWPPTTSMAPGLPAYTPASLHQPPLGGDAPLQATPLAGLEVGDSTLSKPASEQGPANEEDDDEMEISRTLERMQLAAAEAAATAPADTSVSTSSTSSASTAPAYPPPVAPPEHEEETVSLADIRPSIGHKPAAAGGARGLTTAQRRQQLQQQAQKQPGSPNESTLDRMIKEATGEADPSGLFSKESLDRLLRELGTASTASPRDSLDRILAGEAATSDVDLLAARLPGGPLGNLSSTLRSLDRNSLERIIKVASLSRNSEDLMEVDKRTLERMLEAYNSLGRGAGGTGLLSGSLGRDGEGDIKMMSIESLERELKRG